MSTDAELINNSERERAEVQLREAQLRINTMLPCTVTAVEKSTVSVELNILRRMGGRSQPPLELLNVPVMFPGVGDYSLSFPISKGDTGCVFFSQRNIDNWLEGLTAEPANQRLHDYSDAVYMPGLRLEGNAVDIPNALVIKSGVTTVELGPTGNVKIENSIADLVQELSNLADQLAQTVTSPSGGPLSNAPAIAAIAVKLKSFVL